MRKIYGIGETVFDIIFKGDDVQAAKVGGSSLNSMISLGRLKAPASFVSEIGEDQVGDLVIRTLEKNNLETQYVHRFKTGKSAISLAFLDENNDAHYDFFKDYPNQRLQGEIPTFQKDDIILFGSFYGLNQALRPGMRFLLDTAKAVGAIIIYDPNFRSSHLDEVDDLLPTILENFDYADIVRASDEDLKNIFKARNFNDAYQEVKEHCSTLVYTANAAGVDVRTPSFSNHYDVKQIEPVSTIGAGDNFNAGIIYSLLQQGITKDDLSSITESQWEAIIETAGGFSADVCMSYENYISEDYAKEILDN